MIKIATLGAGCFWCIEACFKEIKGVSSVVPGFSGGLKSDASYKIVTSGVTNHAEVAHITFDEDILSYSKILEMFWLIHDPTQHNRQGNDIGSHYRSVIFYHDEEQKTIAETQMTRLSEEQVWDDPIVTELTKFDAFYPAEEYHNNYLENNPENPYCQAIVRPKVDKFKRVFEDLLK